MTLDSPTAFSDEPTLIDQLLFEQRSLTAVELFSRSKQNGEPPSQARYYRDLIPLNHPRPGEQYAFDVDLDQCSGCKGCVTACHALNGLEENESWRNVGLLVGGENGAAIQQTVTTACHHCSDPGCLNGCPVLAYDKDPVTGIVRHLDDQCIGCQYCVMKCPYDVPKYSERLGIVRKCDMCHQRLSEGEAPACVQACPNEAIRITVVHRDDIRARFPRNGNGANRWLAEPDFSELAATLPESVAAGSQPNAFLPSSPEPSYTRPTTRYRTRQSRMAALHAADESHCRPAEPHWPLILLLVLSQGSVGFLSVAAVLGLGTGTSGIQKTFIAGAFGLMALALGIAPLHLGRPLKAWRSFLGWRRSWFSREVIAFGAYFGSLGTLGLASLAPPLIPQPVHPFLIIGSAITGWAAITCSVMLYVDTSRAFWSFEPTAIRFAGTALLLGATGLAIAKVLEGRQPGMGLLFAAVVTLVKLGMENRMMRHLNDSIWTPLKRSARLLESDLKFMARWRRALSVIGGFVLAPLTLVLPETLQLPTLCLMLLLFLTAEVMERYLFFTAVSPERMPGGVST